MMHLFDFNEALVGRRLLGARRSTDGVESQMSMNHAPDPSRHFSMRHEQVKPENKVSQMPALVKKTQNLQMKELLAMETVEAQRVPSVVARLMGLDTFPSESTTNIQPRTMQGSTLSRSLSDKQLQKQKQKQDSQCVPKQLQVQPKQFMREPSYTNNFRSHKSSEKTQSDYQGKRLQGLKEKVNASEAWQHPQVMQLEEMKRQLALKQILVSEKLSEAKRLLTGEQLPDSKWAVTQNKPSELGGNMDLKESLRSSKNISSKYVDNKDTLLLKRSEDHFPVKSKPVMNKKPSTNFKFQRMEDIPDSFMRTPRSEVFVRPIESRRHHDLNIFDAREAGAKPLPKEQVVQRQSGSFIEKASTSESACKGTDWDFVKEKDSGITSGKTRRPTRIVVLKPSPHVQSNEMFMSPGCYSHSYRSEPVIDGTAFLDKSFRDHKTDMHEDPREIAREIARQVREKVVQELARKAKRSGFGRTMSRKTEFMERIDIPDSDQLDVFDVDLKALKSYSKGVNNHNKFEEANGYLVSKKGGRALSQEKFKVAPPENDQTDDKIVVRLEKKLSGNKSSALNSQDSEIPKAGGLKIGSSLCIQSGASNLEEPIESKVNAIQCATKSLPQCTEESTVGLPPLLSSWLPVDRSLRGETDESLEKEMESGNSSGNVMVQDKGLIFEQLRESSNQMQISFRAKSAHREEDTDSESSYFLPKFQSHSENFGDVSDSALDDFSIGHHDVMSENKNSKEINSDAHSNLLTASSVHVTLNCPANVDVPGETETQDPLKHDRAICVTSDPISQHILHVPDEDEFQPCTDESTMEVSEEEDSSDRTDCSITQEDFLIGSDGSEISDDPSPNSVLVSSFEGSPSDLHLNNADSNLREVPVHLELLKWDKNPSQMDDTIENRDAKAEGLSRRADSALPGIGSSICFDDDLMSYFSCNNSPQFEYTKFQMDDIGFPEGKEEDLCYIGNLLNASGFTGRKESYFTKWHSPKHAIDPFLFQRLESLCLTTLQNAGSVHTPSKTRSKDIRKNTNSEPSFPVSTRVDSLHRHLLFDMVDDILLHKLKSHLNYQPWFRPTKLMDILLPSGRQLLKEIWAQLCTFYQQHDGKAFIARPERCLAMLDQWIEIQEEVQRIAFEVEQVIFTELIEEIVNERASLKGA
ncbi:hypothetical protein O6H91_23G012800 [Diphasiastrum complanatum]|nr:hypothetical protein O6H91_23G012800 [Diphasiastrum complanatum]